MAALQRALTREELQKLIETPIALMPPFPCLLPDPVEYDVYHYFADVNEIVEAKPASYYWFLESSPSNSTWMVPNSERQRRSF